MNKACTLILFLLCAQLGISQSRDFRNIEYEAPKHTEEGVSPKDLLEAEWAYLNQYKSHNGVNGTRAIGMKLDSTIQRNIYTGVFQISFREYHDYDVYGRVTQSIHHSFDLPSQSVLPYRKYNHHFSNSPLESRVVTQWYDQNVGAFVNLDSVLSMKNNMLQDTLIEIYNWDATNSTWVLYEKNTVVYNSSGYILEVKREADGTANGWGVTNIRTYTYNAQGQLLGFLDRGVYGSGVLHDQQKYQYTYANGLLVEHLVQHNYNNPSGQLQNVYKTTYTYTPFQALDSLETFAWNSSSWALIRQNFHTYNASGLKTYELNENFDVNGTMMSGNAYEYYYTNSLLDSSITFLWKYQNNNYEVYTKNFPTYAPGGWVVRDSSVLFWSSANPIHVITDFDSLNLSLDQVRYEEINGVLNPTEKQKIEFDIFGVVLNDSNFIFNGTNFELDWVNGTVTDSNWLNADLFFAVDSFKLYAETPVKIDEWFTKEAVNGSLQYNFQLEYFWSQFTYNSVEELTNIVEVYPNPCINNFTIKGDLSGGQLHVYNSSGQLVIVQPVRQNEVVNMEHLPHGTYFIQVFHENNSYTATIVKN